MKYTISALPSFGPLPAPDLREMLVDRSRRCRDVRLPAAQGRFLRSEGALAIRVGGRDLPLTNGARASLAQTLGRGGSSLTAGQVPSLNEWADRHGELLVRLEGDEVRGVLPGAARKVELLDLLDTVTQHLRELPVVPKVEHCVEEDGDFHLTLVAPELAGEVGEGDYIYGGFYLGHSESTLADTEASVRIFRVACRNGALVDANEGQRMVLPAIVAAGRPDPFEGWRATLGRVVARSFDGGDVDVEAQRFRRTVSQVLATPYEILLNLVAQGILSEAEQERIQREFNEGRDDSLFALINAVTFQAHGMRDRNDWTRAAALERLGGEILRGDHQPPVLEPVYS